jgi:signal transduction histidine kinase
LLSVKLGRVALGMRLFLDDWNEGTDTFELSADLAAVLIARRFVMVSVSLRSESSSLVVHVSDPTLAAQVTGRPLQDIVGIDAARALMAWSSSGSRAGDAEIMGVGASPGGDESKVIAAHRVRVVLNVERSEASRILHIVFEELKARPETREELGFIALRRDLEAAHRKVSALENRLATNATERGQTGLTLEGLNHQLRNHLNGILPVCEILAQRPLGPEDRLLVDLMRFSSHAIEDLINGAALPDTQPAGGKSDGGPRLVATTSTFSLKTVVDAVSDAAATQAQARGLTFQRTGDGLDRIRVGGDCIGLRQVLSQVVTEVVATSSAGGVVLDVSRLDRELAGQLHYRFTVGERAVAHQALRVLPSALADDREARLSDVGARVAAMGGQIRFIGGATREIVINLSFIAMTLGSFRPEPTTPRAFSWRR